MTATSAPKSTTSAATNAFHGWIVRVGQARFLTVSVIFHLLLVMLVGTVVLFKTVPIAPDFVAGDEGLLAEVTTTAPPVDPFQASAPSYVPAAPTFTTPSITEVSQIVTTRPASFTVNAPTFSTPGLSDRGAAALAALPKTSGGAMGAGAMGRAGGTKWAMLFGKKVEATRLGVILDVSASGHPYLVPAIQEIEKSFSNFLLVLYPGCGMGEITTKSSHEIRRYASIPKSELPPDPPARSTALQLVKASKIPEFEQLIDRPTLKDKLYVSWFTGGRNTGGGTQSNQTLVAFQFLMSQKVDAIYWFADFRDSVSPAITEQLLKDLQQKKIKVYLHNFASPRIAPEIALLPEGTGGTINVEKPN